MNLADYLTDAPWKAKAACRDSDNSVFFPTYGKQATEARRICMGCVVQTECLEYALSWPAHYDYGIYAGTNAQQRQKLRKERKAAA